MTRTRTFICLCAALVLALAFAWAAPDSSRAQAFGSKLSGIESRLIDSDGTPKRLSGGELDDLKTDLSAYLSEHPDHAEGLYLRGIVHYQLRQYRSARADFEQALRYNPRHAGAYYNLGLALEALSDWGAAREAYAQAVTIDSSFAPAQFNLGRLYSLAGQRKAAESAYYAAWLADPGATRVLVALGNSRWRAGDYRGALSYYDEAAARDGSSLVTQNRALALEGLERYDDALEVFRALAQEAPTRTAPRMGWARCAFRLRLWQEVDAALDPLLSLASSAEKSAQKLKKAAEKAQLEEKELLTRHGRLPTAQALPSTPYGPEVPPRWDGDDQDADKTESAEKEKAP